MIRHARTALLLTAAALLLAACSGWQLRGQTSTPELESITLDGASARLRYTLEDELEPSGVLIHGESQNIVMILDESGSMNGSRWKELVKSFDSFWTTTATDNSETVMITVIMFGTSSRTKVSFTRCEGSPPALDFQSLGSRSSGAGCRRRSI